MHLLAPAKINLHLRVGSRRPHDSFHPLMTWMVTVGLFDTLELERARGWEFVLKTDKADVPGDGKNLVVRAAKAFAQALCATGQEGSATARATGLSAVLRKRIPAGAGLGGGSSDAARTLLALNWLWEAKWSLPNLAALAARLGSDLPFFLHGPSSICTGRGEIVRPTPPPASAKFALLVMPDFAVSTAEAYQMFDAMNFGAEGDAAIASEPDWREWKTLPARQLLSRLVNDLEAAAFIQPKLRSLHGALESVLQRTVRMSGSGSTLFTLYDEAEEAAAAKRRLDSDFTGVSAVSIPIAPDIVDDLSKNHAPLQ